MRQHEVVNPLRGNASPLACKAVIHNEGYYGPFLSEAEWWRRFHGAFNVTPALDDPEKRYGITDVDIARMRNMSAAKKAARAAAKPAKRGSNPFTAVAKPRGRVRGVVGRGAH